MLCCLYRCGGFDEADSVVSMSYALIAAAGIAEVVWFLAMVVMNASLCVICVVALFAVTIPSRKVAIAASVMLGLFTLSFQPWSCFTPFDAEAFEDPDVVMAAEEFRVVGKRWVVASVFTLGAVVTAWWRADPKRPMDPPKSSS